LSLAAGRKICRRSADVLYGRLPRRPSWFWISIESPLLHC